VLLTEDLSEGNVLQDGQQGQNEYPRSQFRYQLEEVVGFAVLLYMERGRLECGQTGLDIAWNKQGLRFSFWN
jgi:hypothetical protein